MRILTFDGGGIRGIVSLVLLQRLKAIFPDILDKTDLYAGTSTGGIIALALAHGHSIETVLDMYVNNGANIFDKTWQESVTDLLGLAGAKYDNQKLKGYLTALFGNKKLADLKKKVVIPSFCLNLRNPILTTPYAANDTWGPVFFNNFNGNADILVTDIALATSAAPTYFPSHHTFIDGGMCANNPSMAAIAQVLKYKTALSDISLCSIGTGVNLSYVSGVDHDWGIGQWAPHLINLLLDANLDVAHFQAQQILQDKYCRLAPVFPKNVNIALDGYDKAQQLIDFANKVDIIDAVSWFKIN